MTVTLEEQLRKRIEGRQPEVSGPSLTDQLQQRIEIKAEKSQQQLQILKDYSKVRDKVLKAVNSEVVRTDLIVNAANSLKQKIHEKTKLITRKEEANVVAFFKDLINDNTVETAYGIVRDLLTDTTSENFLKTVRDKEKGFASNPDLVSAFDPYMEMLKNAKKNRDEG